LIGAGLLAAMAVAGGAAQAQPTAAGGGVRMLHGGFSMNVERKRLAGYARMDNSLAGIAELAAAVSKTELLGRLQAVASRVRYRLQEPLLVPEVLVDIQAQGDAAALAVQLQQLGARHTSQYSNLVSAFLPVDRLKDAAALSGVRFMRASRAFTRTGSITTQGDYFQHSDLVRASTTVPGLTGAGVVVGVLSDSFACTSAITNYPQDVASGDLPSGVQVLEEYDATAAGVPVPTDSCQGATDEGRAMAQVIYDVAPGVTLKFHAGFNGEADFANGILALAGAGAAVIADDAGYYDEPVFQDGIVAQAVDQVKAQGVAYFAAAGNDGRQSYEADFRDSGTVGNSGTDNAGEKLMAFTSLDGKTRQNWLPFSVPLGFQEQSVLILQWDQPYVTGAPNSGGATSALDICLTDNTGVVLAGGCSGANPVGGDPVSITGFYTDGTTPAYGLQVGVVPGTPAPHHVKIIFQDQGMGTRVDPAFATNSATIQGHPGAAGAAAVGASSFRDNPVCQPSVFPAYTLEDYSAAGGSQVVFDASGKKLATAITRQKPDFVAPDGGNTTFFSGSAGALGGNVAQCRNNAGTYNFFGTSAAASHAAGVAALLRQAVPGATPDQIVQVLGSTAILGMANAGGTVQSAVNFDTGHGFIQADKALNALATKVLSLSPGTLGFGNQRTGTVSASQTVTVTNSGGLPVAISKIAVSGPFTQGNTCPATLASQASCQVLVSAAVTAMGPASGSLTITSNDAKGADSVTLAATGVAPVVALSPASADFGQVVVGTAATQRSVTLTNSGSAQLDIAGIAVAGSGFTQSNTCPAALAAGAQCSISIGFTPAAAQPYSGAIFISADGASGSQTQLSLSGQGVQPVAVLSPAALDFGSITVGSSTRTAQGTSGTQQVSLLNSGTAPLHINGISVGNAAFTQANNCPATLPAGSSCTINIDFSPTVAQHYASQLTLNSDSAASGSNQAALSGTGVAPDSGKGGGAMPPWLLLPGSAALLWRRRKRRGRGLSRPGSAC
jgi:hypothetical protein